MKGLLFIFDWNTFKKVYFIIIYWLKNDSNNCSHDLNYQPLVLMILMVMTIQMLAKLQNYMLYQITSDKIYCLYLKEKYHHIL